MNTKKIAYWIVGPVILGVIGYFIYSRTFKKDQKQWFLTEKAQKRNIAQVIRATGYLEAEDLLKIGSIVPGIIKELLVEENETVTKGTLLAIIDDGKDDTEVRETEGLLKTAQQGLTYATEHYQRQKALFEAGQLSKDQFEKATRDYKDAQSLVQTRQAQHDKAKLTYKNKKILAPEDGIIIQKVSSKGETVTLASPATIIYTLAKDIHKMKVQLEIDENRVGEVKKGQTAVLTFDTYPYKKFFGVINDVSNAPIKKQTAVSYHASFILDNTDMLLRPGMTVNARITVGEKADVLSVPGYVFAMNPIVLQEIARITNHVFSPMSRQDKQAIEMKGAFKTLWIVKGNEFKEVPVELGINDNAFFEVKSGLTAQDIIISDIQEPDSMQQLYRQIFGKGL
jgi:HlyD family secretion protein